MPVYEQGTYLWLVRQSHSRQYGISKVTSGLSNVIGFIGFTDKIVSSTLPNMCSSK